MPSAATLGGESGYLILVVEDHEDAREALKVVLELSGYRVIAARDGQEGYERLLACHPDLAIVDIGLPRMDGYQLARNVRAAGATTPLIALTAYTSSSDKEKSAAAGFDAHLGKPAEPEALLEWLAFFLHRPGGTGTPASRAPRPER